MDNADKTIEHAARGYANVQETIRFVDTKTQVVIGLVTVTFGGLAAAALEVFSGDAPGIRAALLSPCICARLLMCLPWVVWLASGTLSLIYSALSLIARPPGSVTPTALFPFIQAGSHANPDLDAAISQLAAGLSDAQIVAEYQLSTLMVTHSMRQALDHGTRTVMLHQGQVVLDVSGDERARMDVPDLLAMFERTRGEKVSDDALLLG